MKIKAPKLSFAYALSGDPDVNEPLGYPIREFEYDKSDIRKNLTGRC